MTRSRLHLPIPALEGFSHKDHWSARDAAFMRDLMAKRMNSPLGEFELISMDRAYAQRREFRTRDDALASQRRIAPLKAQLTSGWRDPESPTILANNDFAQMMLAASVTTPDAPLHPEDVIAPSGVVFFAEKQDFSELPLVESLIPTSQALGERMFDHLGVRGFSWFPTDPGGFDGLQGLMLQLYTDGPDAQHYDEVLFPTADERPLLPLATYQHLHMLTSGFGHLGGDADQYSHISISVRFLMSLVRAVSAIARSPKITEHRPSTETPKQKKLRQRKGRPAPHEVRVLALRHSEHGRYELDAATGRKVRAHWVRGHWRNQWYPRTQEHRTIWIDGFVKGDPEQGSLTGPKVYVD